MSWVTAGAHHLFLQTFKKKCRSHYITMTTFKSFQRRKLFHCCALMKIILCLNTSFSYALKSVGGKIKKSVPQTVTISYDTILISVCILWLAFRSKSYSLCIICSVMCIFCCKRYFLPPGTMKLNSEWLTLILCKSQCVILITVSGWLCDLCKGICISNRCRDQENQENSGCQCLLILCYYKMRNGLCRWQTLESIQQFRGNRVISWPKLKRN